MWWGQRPWGVPQGSSRGSHWNKQREQGPSGSLLWSSPCNSILVSIVVSIPACHAGDRGSIPRRGGKHFFLSPPSLDLLLLSRLSQRRRVRERALSWVQQLNNSISKTVMSSHVLSSCSPKVLEGAWRQPTIAAGSTLSLDKHRWFSGRMLACHAGGPGSIPGRCRNTLFPSLTQS